MLNRTSGLQCNQIYPSYVKSVYAPRFSDTYFSGAGPNIGRPNFINVKNDDQYKDIDEKAVCKDKNVTWVKFTPFSC